MMQLDLSLALSTAIRASKRGRDVVLDYYGQLKKVQEKAQAGLVSEADIESEKAIAEELARAFPAIGILAEETAFIEKREKVQSTMWVVDPLDGTTNYVHQFPVFCISVGLQWHGELVVGVVDAPLLGQTFTCAKGQGAYLNGERISVSTRQTIKESLLATGFIPDNVSALREQLKIFSDLVFEARGVRRAGAAAYDLCLVANGVFDSFWEKNLKPWDAAAGCLMVREAGGVCWTYQGNEYQLGHDSMIAGNKKVATQILDRIKKII